MMQTKHFFLLLICAVLTICQKNNQEKKWEHHTIKTDSIGDINIHILREGRIDKKKPLLVYLEGSGNLPLFQVNQDGRINTSVTLDCEKYASKYHVALISKPGIPFKDSLKYKRSGEYYYPMNDAYKNLYSLDWRAKAASTTIDFLIDKSIVDTSKIVVMGHSEGAQVAPAVANLNRKVTHCIAMMGNALNHLYDFIIQARLQVENNEISPKEGQAIVDSLFIEYEKIYKNPKSTNDYWFGETYLKWSSFTLNTPLENMLKLDIPILYIAGGKDKNQNIINMDYAKLEFLRKGKSNLTYKVFPNYDHYFQKYAKNKDKPIYIDHIEEVHDFAINWANQK